MDAKLDSNLELLGAFGYVDPIKVGRMNNDLNATTSNIVSPFVSSLNLPSTLLFFGL